MKSSTIALAVSGLFSPEQQQRSAGASNLDPSKIEKGQSRAESGKAQAGYSYEGHGKQMASDYLKALGGAAETWQQGVVWLLKHASDKQREEAMTAARKIANDYADETAAQNLKKRISEAMRVFKAATVKGHAKVIALFEGKGSWHQKVAKLPTASSKGRKKNNGAGKTTQSNAQFLKKNVVEEITKALEEAEMEIPEGSKVVTKLADYVAKMATSPAKLQTKHGRPDVGALIGEVRKLSFADLRKVLDVTLFQLSNSDNKLVKEACQVSMKAFDAVDKAAQTKLEKTGTE